MSFRLMKNATENYDKICEICAKSKFNEFIPETLPNLPYQKREHMHERFVSLTVDRHSIRLDYLQEIVAKVKLNRDITVRGSYYHEYYMKSISINEKKLIRLN